METKIFDLSTPESSTSLLKDAAKIIINGGLVVFPTETVYGLGADATNPEATAKIYTAKGRPSDNPLIIHIADPHDVERYAHTNSVYYFLAEHFMPGPLTVILPAKDTVPATTRGGLETVAVRCPENSIARELIRLADVAIAAPSANLSGSPSPTTFDYAYADMNGRVDAIINGGDCDFGLESTIVSLNDDNSLTLLRPGRITKEDFESIGLEVKIANAVTASLKDGETAISPGMKYKHYAPASPLVLLDGDEKDILNFLISEQKSKNCAIICYDEDIKHLENKLLLPIGKKDDLASHGKLLFARLRQCDRISPEIIYAPLPQKNGLGLALYNRMIRAAAHTVLKIEKDDFMKGV